MKKTNRILLLTFLLAMAAEVFFITTAHKVEAQPEMNGHMRNCVILDSLFYACAKPGNECLSGVTCDGQVGD
ncbi:MAG: hypothetical protein KF749_05130 [Bacteroidetes bacterium]|nr:hypothetical protein [Bacteroidota bacterium]MCW5896480.1 hypothetical protein [Bacteroidota bacterium]